ncbi:hypothetical protein B5807_06287 [Epicoccum nigrum]|uniref:C2H2-type domain-containing protein n=1 Tax=Epicoccum nigrum TaxID=105696 RepID=A0A1Y2M1C9_EPING|nr:hypothetical protein B5807_06287 [Epicoccum nigrum]
MCSDAQYSAYAYQYGNGAAELPAGGSPIDGTTSFYEMPGSFPRTAELDAPSAQQPSTQCHTTALSCAHTTPEHLQNYFKANQNATLRRAAPNSVTNLSQLPRLEVPQSRHCVPRLVSDCSPLTPSPISPITPLMSAYDGNLNIFMHSRMISPCEDLKQSQIYAHYGSSADLPLMSPATPSTATSYGSSVASTPLSAYSPTASSSFYRWPQSQPNLQPPMYSQGFLHPDYAQYSNYTTVDRASLWQGHSQLQSYNPNATFPPYETHHYPSNASVIRGPSNLPIHAQSCFEKENSLVAVPPQPISPEPLFGFDEAPPAYSPVLLPPPSTNTQRRYKPSVCQYCGKVFTGKFGPGNCKRHVQQTHETIVDQAMHLCKLCRKEYRRADALRKHQWKKHRLEDAKPRKRRERGL